MPKQRYFFWWLNHFWPIRMSCRGISNAMYFYLHRYIIKWSHQPRICAFMIFFAKPIIILFEIHKFHKVNIPNQIRHGHDTMNLLLIFFYLIDSLYNPSDENSIPCAVEHKLVYFPSSPALQMVARFSHTGFFSLHHGENTSNHIWNTHDWLEHRYSRHSNVIYIRVGIHPTSF